MLVDCGFTVVRDSWSFSSWR